MASITHERRSGRRSIQFVGLDGKRRSIRIGKVNKKQAESAKLFVENLIACKTTGTAPNGTTAQWITGLPDAIRQRLAKAELIKPEEAQRSPAVVSWVTKYTDRRTDLSESTRAHLRLVERNLSSFFGQTTRLDQVTPSDAEGFRAFLKEQGLSEATIRRRCRRVKQFFRAAVRQKLIANNPFVDIKCGDVVNEARRYFVTVEEIEAVLEACPDSQWRLIFALARYGGLRTPSETLRLRWEDIHWDKMRFTVRSPKTEHHGKANRVVPLFPRLHEILLEAFEQAGEGDEYVITKYRNRRGNLRTHARRIIERAGLEPWEKVFQNCRSSLETELADEFPIQTVVAWLGNTPTIAVKHYLQVTEQHFQKAAARRVRNPVHFPVQHAAAQLRGVSQKKWRVDVTPTHCETTQNDARPCEHKRLRRSPRQGLEP